MPLSPERERQDTPKQRRAGRGPRPTPKGQRPCQCCLLARSRAKRGTIKASSRARGRSKTTSHSRRVTRSSDRGRSDRRQQVVKGGGRPRSRRVGRSEPEEAHETAVDTAEATWVHVAGRAPVGTRNCAEQGHTPSARSARATERDATLPKAGPERAGCEAATLGSKEDRHEVGDLVLQCAPLDEEDLDPVSEKAGAILVVVGVGIAESFECEEERRSRGASGGGTPVPLAAPFTAEDASSRLRNPDIDCSFALPREHQAKLRAASARAVRHRLGPATVPHDATSGVLRVSSSSARSASALPRSRPPHATAPADAAVTVAAPSGSDGRHGRRFAASRRRLPLPSGRERQDAASLRRSTHMDDQSAHQKHTAGDGTHLADQQALHDRSRRAPRV